MNGPRKTTKHKLSLHQCPGKASTALRNGIWCHLCVYATIMLSTCPIISKQVKMQKKDHAQTYARFLQYNRDMHNMRKDMILSFLKSFSGERLSHLIQACKHISWRASFHFLCIYTQQWDWQMIRQFYFLIFLEASITFSIVAIRHSPSSKSSFLPWNLPYYF